MEYILSQPHSQSDVLHSISIVASVAAIKGLQGTPMYRVALENLCSSMLLVLGASIETCSPLSFPEINISTTLGITSWDKSLSNSSLEIADDGLSARRPGGVSSFPAALAFLPKNLCSLSVAYIGRDSHHNCITIGLGKRNSFLSTGGVGFGRHPLSWGMQDDRAAASSGAEILSCGTSCKTIRKLVLGDIITMKCNISEKWCELIINFGEISHRFVIADPVGDYTDYVLGATLANDCILKILPHPYECLSRAISLEASGTCRKQHVCQRLRLQVPPNYHNRHTNPTVRCDVCGRLGLEGDTLGYRHCTKCDYDVCYPCTLSASELCADDVFIGNINPTPASMPRNTQSGTSPTAPAARERDDDRQGGLYRHFRVTRPANESSSQSQGTATKSRTPSSNQSPTSTSNLPALSTLPQNSMQRIAIDQLVGLARNILEDPHSTTHSSVQLISNNINERFERDVHHLRALSLSLMYGIAVTRLSLSSLWEVVERLCEPCSSTTVSALSEASAASSNHQELTLLEESDVFSKYLVGPEVVERSDWRQATVQRTCLIHAMREHTGAGHLTIEDAATCEKLLSVTEKYLADARRSRENLRGGEICGLAFSILKSNLNQLPTLVNHSYKVAVDGSPFILRMQRVLEALICDRSLSFLWDESSSADGKCCLDAVQLYATGFHVLLPTPTEQIAMIRTLCIREYSDEGSPSQRALLALLLREMEGGTSLLKFISECEDCSGDVTSDGKAEDVPWVADWKDFLTVLLKLAEKLYENLLRQSFTLKHEQINTQPRELDGEYKSNVPTAAEKGNTKVSGKHSSDSTRDTSNKIQKKNEKPAKFVIGSNALHDAVLRVLEPLITSRVSQLSELIQKEGVDIPVAEKAASCFTWLANCFQNSTQKLLEVYFVLRERDLLHLSETTMKRLPNIDLLTSSHIGGILPQLLSSMTLSLDSVKVSTSSASKAVSAILEYSQSPTLGTLTSLLDRVVSEDVKTEITKDQTHPDSTLHLESLDIAARDRKLTIATNNNSQVITLLPLGRLINNWDVSLSNTSLEFEEENKTVKRIGSRSCYPAALAKVTAPQCSLVIRVEEALGRNNWLTIGICRRGFQTSNTDGLGRTAGSWGVADDRSKEQEHAFFVAEGNTAKIWSRKFKEGDVITVTCDLEQGLATIDVNGDFSFRFSGLVGKPDDYLMGSTLANDHKLRILNSPSYVPNNVKQQQQKNTAERPQSWMDLLSAEIANLRISGMTMLIGNMASVNPSCLPWLSSPLLSGGLTAASTEEATELELLRKLCDSSSVAGSTSKLVSIMKKHVLQDRGQDVTASHAAHAACSALIWHHGLGGEALQLSLGERAVPSDGMRRAWTQGQKLRSFLAEGELVLARAQGMLGAGDLEVANNAIGVLSSLQPLASADKQDALQASGDKETYFEGEVNIPPAIHVHSFPYPGADPSILDTTYMGVIQRARLLLDVAPVPKQAHRYIRTGGSSARSSSSSGADGRYAGNRASTGTGLRLRIEEQKERADAVPLSRAVPALSDMLRTPQTIGEGVLSFIEMGPDPALLVQSMNVLSGVAVVRTKGLIFARTLVSSSRLSSKPSSLWQRTRVMVAISNSLRSHSRATGELHFLSGLDGCPAEEQEKVTLAWLALATEIISSCWLFLAILRCNEMPTHWQGVENEHRSEDAINEAQAGISAALSLLCLDYRLSDAPLIQDIGLMNLLALSLSCGTSTVKKEALMSVEVIATKFAKCLDGSLGRERFRTWSWPTTPSKSYDGRTDGRLEDGYGHSPYSRPPLSDECKRDVDALLEDALSVLRSLLRGASSKNIRFISKDDEPHSLGFAIGGLNELGDDEMGEDEETSVDRRGVGIGLEHDQDSLATDERILEEYAGIEENYLVPSEIVCDPLEAGYVVSDCSIMSGSHSIAFWLWRPAKGKDGSVVVRGYVEKLSREPWRVFNVSILCGRLLLALSNGESTDGFQVESDRPLTQDAWTHICVTIDFYLSRSICIYFNGSISGQKVLSPILLLRPNSRLRSKERIIESVHPYLNGSDCYWVVDNPQACKHLVSFDPLTSTELVNDYVLFYKGTTRQAIVGAARYSGGKSGGQKSYPGVDGVPPLEIFDTCFEVYFHSEASSSGDWGFKLLVTTYVEVDDSDATDDPASSAEKVLGLQALGNTPLFIGQPPSYAMSVRAAQCSVAKLCVYPRVLNEEEIASLPAKSADALSLESSSLSLELDINKDGGDVVQLSPRNVDNHKTVHAMSVFAHATRNMQRYEKKCSFSVLVSELNQFNSGLSIGVAHKGVITDGKIVRFGNDLGTWGIECTQSIPVVRKGKRTESTNQNKKRMQSRGLIVGDIVTVILEAEKGLVEVTVTDSSGVLVCHAVWNVSTELVLQDYVFGATLELGQRLVLCRPYGYSIQAVEEGQMLSLSRVAVEPIRDVSPFDFLPAAFWQTIEPMEGAVFFDDFRSVKVLHGTAKATALVDIPGPKSYLALVFELADIWSYSSQSCGDNDIQIGLRQTSPFPENCQKWGLISQYFDSEPTGDVLSVNPRQNQRAHQNGFVAIDRPFRAGDVIVMTCDITGSGKAVLAVSLNGSELIRQIVPTGQSLTNFEYFATLGIGYSLRIIPDITLLRYPSVQTWDDGEDCPADLTLKPNAALMIPRSYSGERDYVISMLTAISRVGRRMHSELGLEVRDDTYRRNTLLFIEFLSVECLRAYVGCWRTTPGTVIASLI